MAPIWCQGISQSNDDTVFLDTLIPIAALHDDVRCLTSSNLLKNAEVTTGRLDLSAPLSDSQQSGYEFDLKINIKLQGWGQIHFFKYIYKYKYGVLKSFKYKYNDSNTNTIYFSIV